MSGCTAEDVHAIFDSIHGTAVVADVLAMLPPEKAFQRLEEWNCESSSASDWPALEDDSCFLHQAEGSAAVDLPALWDARRRGRSLAAPPGVAWADAHALDEALLRQAAVVADVCAAFAVLWDSLPGTHMEGKLNDPNSPSSSATGGNQSPLLGPAGLAAPVVIPAVHLPFLQLESNEQARRQMLCRTEWSSRTALCVKLRGRSSGATIAAPISLQASEMHGFTMGPVRRALRREVGRHRWETVEELLQRLVGQQHHLPCAVLVQFLGAVAELEAALSPSSPPP
eukprot:EG_transcript_22919